MRIFKFIVILAIIVFATKELIDLYSQVDKFKKEVNSLSKQLNDLQAENKKMEEKIKYLSDIDNLIKEIKSNFNYIKPGEKLIILPSD